MSLLGSSQMASPDAEKADSAEQSARVLVEAIRNDLKPRDIITKKSIENAISLVMATGGSTNAVLHYLAIASAAEVPWTIDDFERIRTKVPVLCDLKPSGKYVAVDFHRAGGVPQVLKMLLKAGLLHGDCMTITGRTIAQELEGVADAPRVRPGGHQRGRTRTEALSRTDGPERDEARPHAARAADGQRSGRPARRQCGGYGVGGG